MPTASTARPITRSRRRLGLGRVSQTRWVVLSMVGGAAVGYAFPDVEPGRFHATDLQVVASVFLRMIKSVVVPLLFGTLVVGIAGHGDDMRRVGKLALGSILYFEVVTSVALGIGLVVANTVTPGVGVNVAAATADTALAL